VLHQKDLHLLLEAHGVLGGAVGLRGRQLIAAAVVIAVVVILERVERGGGPGGDGAAGACGALPIPFAAFKPRLIVAAVGNRCGTGEAPRRAPHPRPPPLLLPGQHVNDGPAADPWPAKHRLRFFLERVREKRTAEGAT